MKLNIVNQACQMVLNSCSKQDRHNKSSGYFRTSECWDVAVIADQAYQIMLNSCSTSLVHDCIRFGRLYHKLQRLQDSRQNNHLFIFLYSHETCLVSRVCNLLSLWTLDPCMACCNRAMPSLILEHINKQYCWHTGCQQDLTQGAA